jgi:hypothetical protein
MFEVRLNHRLSEKRLSSEGVFCKRAHRSSVSRSRSLEIFLPDRAPLTTARRIAFSGARSPVQISYCAKPCARNISTPEIISIPLRARFASNSVVARAVDHVHHDTAIELRGVKRGSGEPPCGCMPTGVQFTIASKNSRRKLAARHHLGSRGAGQLPGAFRPAAMTNPTQLSLLAPARTRRLAPRLQPRTTGRGFRQGACGDLQTAQHARRSPYCTRTSGLRHEPPRYSPPRFARPGDRSHRDDRLRIFSL